MAIAPLSTLLEETLLAAVYDFWPTGIPAPNFHGTQGGLLPAFPILKFHLAGTEEFEEVRGNYFCDVEVKLTTPLSLEEVDSYDYDEQVSKHISVAGTVDDWIANTLETDDLEAAVDGYTNTLTAYEIKLIQLDADIDASDMLMEHIWILQCILFYGRDS